MGKIMPIEDQFIGIREEEKDEPIYRVFSNARLKQTLSNRLLSLVKPAKWDDPFENFLAKMPARLKRSDRPVSLRDFFRNTYGQCWSFQAESDAMWRIYSHNKKGARVRSTPRKLLSAIYNSEDPFECMAFFIGMVRYGSEAAIAERFHCIPLDCTGRSQIETLLWKRPEFEHEREARLLYQFHANGYSGTLPQSVFHFPIDPGAVFDDILFDPRMGPDEFRQDAEEIGQIGYRGPVRQSELYHLPKFDIIIDDA
jgi:hypothetical protein